MIRARSRQKGTPPVSAGKQDGDRSLAPHPEGGQGEDHPAYENDSHWPAEHRAGPWIERGIYLIALHTNIRWSEPPTPMWKGRWYRASTRRRHGPRKQGCPQHTQPAGLPQRQRRAGIVMPLRLEDGMFRPRRSPQPEEDQDQWRKAAGV